MENKITKVEGIKKRVKPKNEKWFLRIKNQDTFEVITITKRERNILNGIRKMLIAFKIPDVDLTNRKKYIKNLHVSQDKLLRMKANNKFKEYVDGAREVF